MEKSKVNHSQQKSTQSKTELSTQRLRIGRSNFKLPSDIQSKESTLQVAYDVLRRCPFFKAFLVTADVPEIYMQEFESTAYVHKHSIRFKLDNKKHIVNLETFRDMLHICPRILGQSFDELPFVEEILKFFRFLGHSAQIRTLTDVNINKLFQPWRSFRAVINKYLTGKSSGFDSFRDDMIFSTIKVVSRHQNTQQYGVMLPIKLTNDEIRNTKAYKEYYAYATGEATPKPKAGARRKRSGSDSSITPPTAITTLTPTVAVAPRLAATTKGKQPAKAKSPSDPSEVARTKAQQLKIVLRRSRQQTHISQLGGSGTDEGTGFKPGVQDIPSDDSEEEISWNSSDDEDADAEEKDRDDDEGDEKMKVMTEKRMVMMTKMVMKEMMMMMMMMMRKRLPRLMNKMILKEVGMMMKKVKMMRRVMMKKQGKRRVLILSLELLKTVRMMVTMKRIKVLRMVRKNGLMKRKRQMNSTETSTLTKEGDYNYLKILKTLMTMATIIEQQMALDEALVPSTQRCPFFKAFLVTADVPEIYMQEFWATAYVHQYSIRFKMDNKKHIVNLNIFRDMLHICPRIHGQSFDELPFEKEILDFLRHQNTQQYGAMLPIEFTNEKIINTKAYKEYYVYATREAAPKPKASARRKKSAKATKSKSLSALSEVAMTEAEQLKLVLKRSRQQMHISQPGGSGTDEGTEKERDDDEGYEKDKSDDGEEDDDEEKIAKIDEHDDTERGGDDDEESKSDEENDDEETREEESFDPIPRTPEDSEDDGNDEEDQGFKDGEEEWLNEEEEADELYRDVDINQGRGLQLSQDIEDSHVTLTPVKPDGQQESSSVSSQFVTNMLNPTSDAGVESIFATASSSVAPLPTPTPTMTPSIIATITTASQATIPPTPILREVLQNLPTFDSVFRFDERLKSLEASFSEYRQTNPFAEVRIIKEQVKGQVKDQVSKILPRIKQSVNAQLEAEVLTRSSHSSRTSYVVAADLLEMELRKILIEKMEGNKSIQHSDEQRNLYKALVEAYEADKIILDTYKETVTLKRRRDDESDKDEGPSAGSDRGSKRRRDGKEPESASAPLQTATRSADRSTTGSKSRQASTSAEDQPIVQSSRHPEWFSQPKKPPTLDRDWNKTLPAVQGSTQTWISELAKQADSRSSFNKLLDTPLEFSNFIMNRLKFDTLTPKLLARPTYELMKGSCKSLTELKYHLEEPFSLIPDNRGRRVIPFAHFINNDLEYLRGGASSRKYTTSVTKTKAADYGHIKWIKDLVPRTMWIQEPINYDKHALWGVSHWGQKRQQFYGFAVNQESSLDVYSKRRIIAVTNLKIVEWHSYKHLDWITVRHDDEKLYKFKEGEFKRGGDDDEESESDEESDDEEIREEESFDPIPRTPEDSEDNGNGEEDQGLRISEEERLNEEEKAYELYQDVNINQGRELPLSQDIKDSHVTLTPVNPDGHEVLQNLPTFDLVFCFDERLKSLEASFSEYKQTNPFSKAVSNIPGIVHQYMNQQMNRAVRVAVQIQTDWLRDSYQRENDEFLRTIDDNMKRIIKEQVKGQVKEQVLKILPRIEQSVNAQLKAEVLTRSSHSSRTSYAVAANLSEMELKKILIEKMEGNKEDVMIMVIKVKDPLLDQTRGQRDREKGKSLNHLVLHYKLPPGAQAEDQPIVQSSQHPKWFSQLKKPPTLDRDWNKTLLATQGSTQSRISDLAKQTDFRSSFNELLDTLLDFSNFIMNQLRVDTLTPKLLAGPTYELMKGSCQQYPHNLLQPLSLIPDNRGRHVIPFAHFINYDLEYLRGGASSRKYTTSVRKMKAADYENIKWIEDLFYGFAVNRESALDVYSKRRIIGVTDLKIVEWHNYKHLNWISVRRDDDKIYKFKEGNFKRLRLQDIEDMLLLLVQGKLSNLTVKERFAFNKRLNLMKPDTYRSDLKHQEAYTTYSNPRGFIYQNKDKKNRLMRIDELHKFSDRTLNDVCNALDDHLKRIII
nr:hypothetical protein [Tanacetum cinerariifolium]